MALDTAQVIDDMNIAGFRTSSYQGRGEGSLVNMVIWVNGNWRFTFEFREGQSYVLDYEDYH